MQNRLALVFILVTVMIDSIGIGIIFPVMPDLMREVTGADLASASLWGGLLATSFAAMQFLCGPIVGNLSDRYGRRPVMLIALMVMALDYAIMAVAQSVWLLLLGRLIAGAAAATYATAAAYVADISAPGARAKNFGLIGAAFGAGGFAKGLDLVLCAIAFVGAATRQHFMGHLGMAVAPRELAGGIAVPVEPQPFQPAQDRRRRLGLRSGAVGILDSQQELSAATTGKEPVEQGRPCPADMQIAGG